MSKKKVAGSTMTLKDFHGGSIPSDLPLPSAPGVTARPSDRLGFDRPAPWGNPAGRSDLRSRLNSTSATRHFDDKTPFLTPIGRNFDEDERKPLDGVSAPRRTISDDTIRASTGRLELKPQQFSEGKLLGQSGPLQVSPFPSQTSYLGGVSRAPPGSVGSQNVHGNSGLGVHGSMPNAWAARKEPVGVVEAVQPAWSASTAGSKLIHASALEKVSSGRWQSKQSIPYEAEIEIIKHVEESGLTSKAYDSSKYNRIDAVDGRGYVDVALPRQIERNLTVGEGVHGARREISDVEVDEEPPIHCDDKGRNGVVYAEAFQPVHAEGRVIRSEFQRPMSAEAFERPKLRLLPRSKPLENPEQPFAEQVIQRPGSAHSESSNVSGPESGSQTVERPKLNLKPRALPLEKTEGNADRDRSSVFGGARPRELVLKERGFDDVKINNYDLGQSSERTKQVGVKTERAPGTVISTTTRQSEKSEKLSSDQRNGRRFDRKDQQAEDRSDPQKRNWRNDNRKSTRDNTDRQQMHHEQQQERRPSPEIWRKPVEEMKPPSPEPGVRFGKAASAADLAQAFSRPRSAPKTPSQLSSLPGQGQPQTPFSRLAGQAPRTQINGY